mmetsp:Transcript_2434/g.6824  ORF Transcript_2434/g.6824 Transcript_2434/m.6824 type:complete len:285 (-) Transcript_2434:197-1051(-)
MGNTLCCSSSPSRLSSLVGPPTAAVCPPGQCVFTEDWSPATLVGREQVTHDTILVTFRLPRMWKPLGLSTCACVLCRFDEPNGTEPVVRPYTPVSTNAMLGRFQLVIKLYDLGKMSQHLNSLPLGSPVEFRHSGPRVSRQYPFGAKHLTMLAGGTGITPMIQALHAVLGTPGDGTQVSLVFGNKAQEDILCRELLESWSERSGGRLKVTHVLSQAAFDASWRGRKGFITRELLEKHTAPPSEDVLVMVCGPPPMCKGLCGPRDEPELTGILGDMGYTAEQVFKF